MTQLAGAARGGLAVTAGVALALALLIPMPISAQQRLGPPARPLLQLDRLNGYVQLGVRSRLESRSRPSSGADSVVDELKVDETLHLSLAGSVYHPRLLTFDGEFDLRFLQQLRDGEDDILPGGNWNLQFFKDNPYSFSFYGDVRDEEVDRQFARTFDLESQFYGLALRVNKGPVPGRVALEHRFRKRSDAGFETSEVGDFLIARGNYELAASSTGRLDYLGAIEDIRDQQITRHRFLATNTTYFDPGRRRTLRSNLNFRQQSDAVGDRFTASIFTTYDWRHTDRLASRYSFDYQRDDINGAATDAFNLDASLRHRLYESLDSRGEVFGRFQNADFASTLRYGGRLTESYSKDIWNFARLGIALGGSAEVVSQDARAASGSVVDEGVTFSVGRPVPLREPNVEPGTVGVTDPAGSLRLINNIDYRLLTSGAITEIQRIPTGDIPPGGAVLVSYRFRLTGTTDILTQGINLNVRFSVPEWGAVYGSLLTSQEELLSGFANRPLEDRFRRLVGATYSRGPVNAIVEYEVDDSIFRSFEELRESISVGQTIRPGVRFRLAGSHAYRQFTDSDEQVRYLRAAATAGARLGRSWLAEAEFEYQSETWSGSVDAGLRDLEGVSLRLSLTWFYRQFEVQVGGRYSRFDRQGLQEDVDRIFFRVRRYF